MIITHKNSLNDQQHDIRADGSFVTLTANVVRRPHNEWNFRIQFATCVKFEKNKVD